MSQSILQLNNEIKDLSRKLEVLLSWFRTK